MPLIFLVKNAVLNERILFGRTSLYILLDVYANRTLNPDKFSIVIKLARKLLLLKLVRFAHNWNDSIFGANSKSQKTFILSEGCRNSETLINLTREAING